jgi:hypothetical protein
VVVKKNGMPTSSSTAAVKKTAVRATNAGSKKPVKEALQDTSTTSGSSAIMVKCRHYFEGHVMCLNWHHGVKCQNAPASSNRVVSTKLNSSWLMMMIVRVSWQIVSLVRIVSVRTNY